MRTRLIKRVPLPEFWLSKYVRAGESTRLSTKKLTAVVENPNALVKSHRTML